MLGWQINIHRLIPGESQYNLTKESLLASWTTSLGGLDWIEALVKDGKAEDLGGTGYPCWYKATAKIILPIIMDGPPRYKGPPVFGNDYILPSGWTGEVKIDHSKIAECLPDEQLIIEAWDQS
jgi:hypothetical protein